LSNILKKTVPGLTGFDFQFWAVIFKRIAAHLMKEVAQASVYAMALLQVMT
jgi:hypothetical protein